MSKHLVFGLILVNLSLMVGCAKKPLARQPLVRPTVELTAGAFSIAWRAEIPLDQQEVLDNVFVRDNVVVAYTNKNRVVHLNRGSGSMISQAFVGRGTRQRLLPPLITQDRSIYATTTSLEIHDKEGKFIRSIEVGAPVRAAPAAPTDTRSNLVYLVVDKASHGRLQQLDVTQQPSFPNWEIQTEGSMSAAPAVFQSYVYFAGVDGRVYAVNESRRPVWPIEDNTFPTGGRIIADIMADDFGVYVASEDTKLYCLDRNRGKIKWEFYAGKVLNRSPCPTADAVYIPVSDLGVVCIDKVNGQFNREQRWNCPQADAYLSSDDVNAYLMKTEIKEKRIVRTILAVDKKTGFVKSSTSRADLTAVATNLKDSLIYATTASGEILAIKPVIRSGGVGELVLIDTPINAVAMSH